MRKLPLGNNSNNTSNRVSIINGPNINMLGIRETHIYGHTTLEQIEKSLLEVSSSLCIELDLFQSNSESKLIDYLQNLVSKATNLIILNPAGLTGSSVAMRDALLAVNIPFYEVHLSNIYSRGPLHEKSIFSEIADGILVGFGNDVYRIALHAAKYYFTNNEHM